MRVRAPAKLNLHLQVVGRRPDGFHELRTLFQAVDLHDELVAELAPSGILELTVEPEGWVDAGDDNLVLQAAHAVVAAAAGKRGYGARIHLRKKIPVGAGLGGGSADAAAALVLLDCLWGTRLGRPRLFEMARSLGSDVPYFLHGGLALGVGRGEEVYPLPDLAEMGVVVASTGAVVPTAGVYAALARPASSWELPETGVYFMAADHAAPAWALMRNDLEAVVCEGWPEVRDALGKLATSRPLRAAVTGSGSAVFAVYESPAKAEAAAASMSGFAWMHVGRFLARSASRLEPEAVRRRAGDVG